MRFSRVLIALVAVLSVSSLNAETLVKNAVSKALADTLYVNASGDTMTGDLAVANLTINGTCTGCLTTFTDYLSSLSTGYLKVQNLTGLVTSQVVPIPVADGGTNAVTASAARTSLGLAIGTNVQAWDADLDTIAGKTIPSGSTLADTSSSQAFTTKTYNGLTVTTTTGTLTLASGKTATINNSLTLAGTDSTTMTFPTTSATIARTDAGNGFTGNQSINTTPSGTTGRWLYVLDTGDNVSAIRVENTNAAGTSALAQLQVQGDTAAITMNAHGTARTTSRWGAAVGAWGELLSSGGNGLAIGTSASLPLKLGTAGVTGIQFDGTNPHPSFPVSDKRVSTQFDSTGTTLTNITGLTVNVTAGKSYQFRVDARTTSNIAGGIKFAMAGTATATAIVYDARCTDTTAIAIGTARGTAMATTVANVTAVTAAYCTIDGLITVNAAGTLTTQFANNVATGTSSVLVGSTYHVVEVQ